MSERPPLRVVEAEPASRKPAREGRVTRARRKRAKDTEPEEAARFVLGAANLVAGALDLFGALAKGEPVVRSARKALRRTKRRGRALEKAYTEGEDET